MTLSTTHIQLAEKGKTIYMLNWGEYEDKVSLGPYVGDSDINFYALTENYQCERYASKEAALENECVLSENDFVDWLLEKNILRSIESKQISVYLNSSCDATYAPKHWPECPECGDGRGKQKYGECRRSLNRIVTLFECTDCCHHWGHKEIANNPSLPMLDDDGRDTPSGCVPFSMSKACGIPFSVVANVCRKHGWNHHGMAQVSAAKAAVELGFNLIRQTWIATEKNTPTLKRLLADLPSDRNYIIGVKNHWLAYVQGDIVDNDTQTGLARRVIELYEVRKI